MKALIPSFTQIPNVLIDEWMVVLSPAAFKVIMVIVRQTYGWIEDKDTGRRKLSDWISHSQFQEKTGYKDEAIGKALAELETGGYILITDQLGQVLVKNQRNGKKLYYRVLQPNLPENREGGTESTTAVPNLPENRVSKIEYTKETYTKDKDNKLSLGQKPKEEEGKGKTERDPVIDHIIDTFTKNVGQIPCDKQPRRVAHNIRQLIETFNRQNGEAFSRTHGGQALTFAYTFDRCWNWYKTKSYCEDTEKLETFKLKIRVYLDTTRTKLQAQLGELRKEEYEESDDTRSDTAGAGNQPSQRLAQAGRDQGVSGVSEVAV